MGPRAEFGPMLPMSSRCWGQIRPTCCRTWPGPRPECRPMPGEFGRQFGRNRPSSVESGLNFAENPDDVGRTRCPQRASPRMAKLGPHAAQIAQTLQNPNQTWPESGQHRPNSCNTSRIRQNARKYVDKLIRFGRNRRNIEFGQLLSLARSWTYNICSRSLQSWPTPN